MPQFFSCFWEPSWEFAFMPTCNSITPLPLPAKPGAPIPTPPTPTSKDTSTAVVSTTTPIIPPMAHAQPIPTTSALAMMLVLHSLRLTLTPWLVLVSAWSPSSFWASSFPLSSLALSTLTTKQ